MTDADLRALCARVAREAFGAVKAAAVANDGAQLDVGADGCWCVQGGSLKRVQRTSRPCTGGWLLALPLSVPYPGADALAAALYDAAKAQGAAEGGP